MIQAFMTISDYWTFFEHSVLLPFFTTMESYHRLPSASCFPLTVCGYPSTECCLAVDTWFPFSHWHRHSQADFPKGSVWDRALYASDSAGWAACSPPTPSPVLGELHTHSCPTPLSVSLPCPWASRPLHHAILSAPQPPFPTPSCRKQCDVASVWACIVGIPLPSHPGSWISWACLSTLYPSSCCPRGHASPLTLWLSLRPGFCTSSPHLSASLGWRLCKGVLWDPCCVGRASVRVFWRPGPR